MHVQDVAGCLLGTIANTQTAVLAAQVLTTYLGVEIIDNN
jgi:hypothetical protein